MSRCVSGEVRVDRGPTSRAGPWGKRCAAHTLLPCSPGLVPVGAREEGWRLLAGHSHIRSGARSYSVTSGRGPTLPAPLPGSSLLG